MFFDIAAEKSTLIPAALKGFAKAQREQPYVD